MFVEVRPAEGVFRWEVVEYTVVDGETTSRVLATVRPKSRALLIGTGAAMALRCERRVKDRNNEYTVDATSFGGDSPDVPG